MIDLVNRDFVAVAHNLSADAVPEDLPGPDLWRQAYSSVWKNRFGYATTAVIAPDGRFPLGGSGTINWWDVHHCTSSNPSDYLGFLETCLDRYARWKGCREAGPEKADDLHRLQGEILESLRKGHLGRKQRKLPGGPRKP